MRIINKKYLLIILLVGVILAGVIIMKPKEKVQLDNVILKQEINNKTMAIYIKNDDIYEAYDGTKFPDMYVLNLTESKCIDNNGNELNDVLSYENNKVVIEGSNTTYCYLYFDKSLGLQIKKKNPNSLKIDKVRGEMYRFQGQQSEGINNYICFGTSNKEDCVKDTDHYMYRIIGIEAETGRVKVIKKEALNNAVQWWNDYDTDIEFPKSRIYEAINGNQFLKNTDYVPFGWEEKIDINTWIYGDIINNSTLDAYQTGEKLYLIESGQIGTIWYAKAQEGDEGAQETVVGYDESKYYGKTIYYIRHNDEKWTKTFDSKVSLMYLYDYHYSVSDEDNCQYDKNNYSNCQTGWMHLSQNDSNAPNVHEWTMSRYGWYIWGGYFLGREVHGTGYSDKWHLTGSHSARPVFYINASEELLNETGIGTINNPFLIK